MQNQILKCENLHKQLGKKEILKGEGLTMPFSIIICLVYFLIMIVTSFIVFKKRNIKNV